MAFWFCACLAVLVLAELVALHDLLIVALQLGLLQLLGQVPGQSLTLPGQLRRGGIPGIGNGGQVPRSWLSMASSAWLWAPEVSPWAV